MRKLTSKKIGSEDVRSPKSLTGWWPGGGKAGGKPEERKKIRKEERQI